MKPSFEVRIRFDGACKGWLWTMHYCGVEVSRGRGADYVNAAIATRQEAERFATGALQHLTGKIGHEAEG